MSTDVNGSFGSLSISSKHTGEGSFPVYSSFDQALDELTIGFVYDPSLPSNVDESEVSPSQAQCAISTSRVSSFGITDLFSHTNSRAGTPAFDHIVGLPVTLQYSLVSVGSVTTPPKIGTQLFREAVRILREWVSSHSKYPFPTENG
ncbi:hypothetical protein NW769_009566 [Fusarium oxysporum]|nr:hypothetical protein NW769_009566 [Fusarium oxysporum]